MVPALADAALERKSLGTKNTKSGIARTSKITNREDAMVPMDNQKDGKSLGNEAHWPANCHALSTRIRRFSAEVMFVLHVQPRHPVTQAAKK
jgi:hypothetical protein